MMMINDSVKTEIWHPLAHLPTMDEINQCINLPQLELFFLKIQLQIIQMHDLNSEFPALLKSLKKYLSDLGLPEYTLAMCYPFSQEFLVFHALEPPLASDELHRLKSKLLNCALNVQIQSEMDPVWIENHQCYKLFNSQSCSIWRIYFDFKPDKLSKTEVSILKLLDHHIQQAFLHRVQQQEKIQHILQAERREFSADLHDSIAQIIGFLRLKSSQLNTRCKQQEQYVELRASTEELATYTHYAYQQVRDLITASRLTYQELDFLAAIKKIIYEFEQQSRIVFELDCRTPQLKVSAKQSVQLLYILRESLSNIVRHSHASNASILIYYSAQSILNLKISDDGRGIQAKQKRMDSFGLDIMQERAERIGAELKIYANSPKGTCIQIILQINSGEFKDE